ncbi:MAG: peptide chain release factor N(5)-glutamine methyltransferase [Saprospiraceae bacterium]|nr:peptide chain release factor N(5)-glutamine methyltransferase [Saprospiraceae bacterium]
MTYKFAFDTIRDSLLQLYDVREASNIARIVLEDLSDYGTTPNRETVEIPTSIEYALPSIIMRLLKHEPIQYITGMTYFYGFKFYVNKNVLIPRPETEELVHEIIKDIKNIHQRHDRINVLDIGTGSGCIAISIDKKIGNCNISGWDKSCSAIEVAKYNNSLLNAQVNFECVDIFDDESVFGRTQQKPQFDIITSNPPYIPENEKQLMSEQVIAYEPHEALFVSDANPLIFYERIASLAKKLLYPGGRIYFECNEFYAEDTLSLLKDLHFDNITLINDLQNKPRILKAIKNI